MASGCATTHLLQPVGKNNVRINVSGGGPAIRLGGPIPLPLVSVNAAYGVEDDLDIHAGLHPVAAAFNPGAGSTPLMGINAGATWHPIQRWRHALSIGGELYAFGNRRDAVVFANAWIGGSGRPTRWLLLGGGVHNLLRVGSSEPEVDARPFWTPTLFGLAEFGPIGRVTIDLEARWYAFTQNGRNTAPEFFPIGSLGALGVMLGVNYTFPEVRR